MEEIDVKFIDDLDHDNQFTLAQLYGQDLISLFLGIPLLIEELNVELGQVCDGNNAIIQLSVLRVVPQHKLLFSHDSSRH